MSRKSGKLPPSFCLCRIFLRCPPWEQRKVRLAHRGLLMALVMATWIGVPDSGSARSLQDIIDRRAFSICAHPDAAPFSMRTPQAAGLQIDLAHAIARQLGVELQEEWVLFQRDARKVGCDAIMAGIAHDARDDEHHPSAPGPAGSPPVLDGVTLGPATSRPYAASLTRVVVHSGARAVSSIDDLKGRAVAVLHASYTHYVLDTRGIKVRTLYPTEADILEAVDKGEMEAGVVSEWSVGWYLKRHPDARIHSIDHLTVDPDLDFNVGVVLRNADRALLARVNDIVASLISSGEIERIFRDYGIPYRPPL
jgi:polar amino acid transport system substrate-binding protein